MLDLVPIPPMTPAAPPLERPRRALVRYRQYRRGGEAMQRALAGAIAPASMVGVAIASVFATVAFLAGWPVAIPWLFAAGGAHYVGAVTRHAVSPAYARRIHGDFGRALHLHVSPDDIEPDELRSTYLLIVRTHEELRTTLQQHDPVSAELYGLYQACGDAVQLAGRTALLGGPTRRFLDGRRLEVIAEEIVRLDTLASAAGDREARDLFTRASAARRREAELHAEIETMYLRTRARLEAVSATLAAAAAASLQMCTLGVDESTSTRDALIEQIDALDEDLRYLEDTVAADVAA